MYGDPTISLSNNTVVTITQPFDGGGYMDRTGKDEHKYQYDYINNKNIKDDIANGWMIKTTNISYNYCIPYWWAQGIIKNGETKLVEKYVYSEDIGGYGVVSLNLRELNLNITYNTRKRCI